MRYYKIIITPPKGGQVWTPSGFTADLLGEASFTSHVNGQTLTGAWDISFNLPVAVNGGPDNAMGILQIKGVSLADIAQANNLLGYKIEIYGGMAAGLPLASAQASQAGRLIYGQILKAFGNWIGAEMSLDFVILNSPMLENPLPHPSNLCINCPAGTALSGPIANALKTGFPSADAPTVNISPSLVAANDIVGIYGTLDELARTINTNSKIILSGSVANYTGVQIWATSNSFAVSDGTVPSTKTINLNFQDLVGQPTWIEYPHVQIKTVMRGDIGISNYVKLPPGTLTTTTAAGALQNQANQQRDSSVFQGKFQVDGLIHFGQFRQPQGDSWATVISAYPVPSGS